MFFVVKLKELGDFERVLKLWLKTYGFMYFGLLEDI